MPPFTTVLIATFSFFVLANIYRVVRVIRMPAHLRWELYPIPKGPRDKQRYGGSYFEETNWWTRSMQSGCRGQMAFMLKEVLLLRGVFENFRALWVWSLLLHWGLYLYIASTALVVGAFAVRVPVASASSPVLQSFGGAAYGAACCLGAIGSFGLIATRILNSRLQGFTTRATIFNLCLFIGIFVTGLIALLIPDRGFLATLRTVDWRPASGEHSPAAYLHFGLVGFFLVYFPFTHMTHMYMKYFTWHDVRWDDIPMRFDEGERKTMAVNLGRQVSWQAPHIRGAKLQSWAEVTARSGQQGKGGND
ncbi:MAG: hypothetical protein ACLPSO_11930 [Terracidiphilus sp.]